ncbi:PRP38 family-domain-containing protein [Calycina marina]|uniref:Pre-mRNA-splicing factor 38 n=1 Tax=Calycina marina TaxID=1763456 RepID=A0A9P7Z2S1_9HELO|nr:PRP38 family-domain-containing protein [Calycina marina]
MANHRADEKRFLDDRGTHSITTPNGLNPATIMEKPVRERIIECFYWKAYCFALNECDIVTRVVEDVNFIGGTIGDSQAPSPFLCLVFKLLQLSPSHDIILSYLNYGGEKFKYLRALACFYVRLTYRAKDVYELLEPFLGDWRKLRRKGRDGGSRLTFLDEFVDGLLTKERMCSTALVKMVNRVVLEDLDQLEPRVSSLGDIEALLEESDGEIEEGENGRGEERGDGSESTPEVTEKNGDGRNGWSRNSKAPTPEAIEE